MVRRGQRYIVREGPQGLFGVRDFSLRFNEADTFFVITAILLCTFVAISYQLNMNRAIMAIVFSIFLIGAIAIRGWMTTNKEEDFEDIKDVSNLGWMNITSLGLLGFVGIAIAQYTVLTTLNFEYLAALDPYDRAFGYVAAVAEEWFFRALLLKWLIRMTRDYIISSIIDSAIFSMYHYVVYVIFLGSTAALWAVFASSLVLCAVLILSRSITAPIISHSLINVGLRVML